METMTVWLREYALIIMLAIGTIFNFKWLHMFRKDLNMNQWAVVIASIVHTLAGVASVSLFAAFENLIDPSATGRMSLFGGVFLLPFLYYAWARKSKCRISKAFDVFCVCIIFTLMCARINCIISGCCEGKIIPGTSSVRWPTREMEIIFYIFLLISFIPKTIKGKTCGQQYPLYMVLYGVFRLITETLRVSGTDKIFHLAHIWALVSILIGVCVYMELRKDKTKVRR